MPSCPDLTCGTSLQTSRMISVGQFLTETAQGESEMEQQGVRHPEAQSDSHEPFLPATPPPFPPQPLHPFFFPSKESFPRVLHPSKPSPFCSHPKLLLPCPGLPQALSPVAPH